MSASQGSSRRAIMAGGLGASLAVLFALTAAAGETPPGYSHGSPLAAGAPTASAETDARALSRAKTPPLGLPPMPLPPENELTAAKISLGRKLFFDRRLSINNTMSCGMCHIPEQGWTNNELATPVGVEGRGVRRNSPALFNVGYQKLLFHDGRETTLETQIFSPLMARNEMANPSIGHLVEKVKALPDYSGLFEGAFGGPATIHRMANALAGYQRTLSSANSPFDRYFFGAEKSALNANARRGFDLFQGKGNCVACHRIEKDHALFTDHQFHNTGLARAAAAEPAMTAVELAPGVVAPMSRQAIASVGGAVENDLGRHEVTLDPADLWKFKTPSLRNVALTAPYLHDGSLRSLEAVVRSYNSGGDAQPGRDPKIRPLGLKEPEIGDLVAFLESLTGDNVGELQRDARSVGVGN
jgi:cytochrome c peroxidase